MKFFNLSVYFFVLLPVAFFFVESIFGFRVSFLFLFRIISLLDLNSVIDFSQFLFLPSVLGFAGLFSLNLILFRALWPFGAKCLAQRQRLRRRPVRNITYSHPCAPWKELGAYSRS